MQAHLFAERLDDIILLLHLSIEVRDFAER